MPPQSSVRLHAYPTDDQFAESPEATPEPELAALPVEDGVRTSQHQCREAAPEGPADAAVREEEMRVDAPSNAKAAENPRRFRLPVILEEEEHHIADMEWSQDQGIEDVASSFAQRHGLPVDWVPELIKAARSLAEMRATPPPAAGQTGVEASGKRPPPPSAAPATLPELLGDERPCSTARARPPPQHWRHSSRPPHKQKRRSDEPGTAAHAADEVAAQGRPDQAALHHLAPASATT